MFSAVPYLSARVHSSLVDKLACVGFNGKINQLSIQRKVIFLFFSLVIVLVLFLFQLLQLLLKLPSQYNDNMFYKTFFVPFRKSLFGISIVSYCLFSLSSKVQIFWNFSSENIFFYVVRNFKSLLNFIKFLSGTFA